MKDLGLRGSKAKESNEAKEEASPPAAASAASAASAEGCELDGSARKEGCRGEGRRREGSVGKDGAKAKIGVPLSVFANGLEGITAAVSPWDRHLKTALKRFLNANGANPPLRTGFGMGTEWNVEAVAALQIFLNTRGGATIEVTKKMGLDGHALFGLCDDDPTVAALQTFLNSQMVREVPLV